MESLEQDPEKNPGPAPFLAVHLRKVCATHSASSMQLLARSLPVPECVAITKHAPDGRSLESVPGTFPIPAKMIKD